MELRSPISIPVVVAAMLALARSEEVWRGILGSGLFLLTRWRALCPGQTSTHRLLMAGIGPLLLARVSKIMGFLTNFHAQFEFRRPAAPMLICLCHYATEYTYACLLSLSLYIYLHMPQSAYSLGQPGIPSSLFSGSAAAHSTTEEPLSQGQTSL